jgi:TonB-dependent receptor-like protein
MLRRILIGICVASANTIYCQDDSKYSTDTIDVRAEYFKKPEVSNTSFTHATYEDLRKTPGAGEDIIKYFQSSPGVAISSDYFNDLIVRGGSPIENLVTVDGMEIKNPNHYGPPGSTSGALTYINLNLVKEADFYNGAFPALYGDRISSVLDIRFKEGNLKKHIQDVNLSMLGFGGFFEGPVSSRTSYMLSIRRSYFELVKGQLKFELLPNYWDVNMKLSFNISRREKLSWLTVFAIDNAYPYESEYSRSSDTVRTRILTIGINYLLLQKKYDLNISLSGNMSVYKADYNPFLLDIFDNDYSLNTNLKLKLAGNLTLEGVAGIKYLSSKYDVYSKGYLDYTGYVLPAVSFNQNVQSYKLYSGVNFTAKILNSLELNTGTRFDFYNYMSNDYTISPRAGITCKLTKNTSLNANAGIYYQTPELLWLLADPDNVNLSSIKAVQFVAGIDQYVGQDIKITFEGYSKRYTFYPVSVYNPLFIFINSGVGVEPSFIDRAVSAGRGYFQGLEFSVQKKNSGKGFYASMNVSLTRSSFIALSGIETRANFDYGKQLMLIGGYKFAGDFSAGMRFKYAGSRPYTPFDYDMSRLLGNGRYQPFMYNQGRMPEYVRLDVRIDKSFNFGNKTLTGYVEVFNVLNRANTYRYLWRSSTNNIWIDYQFSILPVLGLSIKF